jgi:hypothetical protein
MLKTRLLYPLMKALSFYQPFAWAIANGHIDIDDRTWGTAYRGPLAIHASKRFHSGYHFYLREILRLPVPDVQELEYGGVIAVAELVDCLPPGAPTDVPIHRRAHGGGHCHGLVLKDVQKVQFVPCKGKQGMFTLDLPELQPATPAPSQDKLF